MYADHVIKDTIKIRDSVHGYIVVPTPVIEKIVDTQLFQRVRA